MSLFLNHGTMHYQTMYDIYVFSTFPQFFSYFFMFPDNKVKCAHHMKFILFYDSLSITLKSLLKCGLDYYI